MTTNPAPRVVVVLGTTPTELNQLLARHGFQPTRSDGDTTTWTRTAQSPSHQPATRQASPQEEHRGHRHH